LEKDANRFVIAVDTMLHINMETFLVANERNGACHFDIDAKLVQNMLTTLGVDAEGSNGILFSFETLSSDDFDFIKKCILALDADCYTAQAWSDWFKLNHDLDESTKILLTTLLAQVNSSTVHMEETVRSVTETIGSLAPEGVFKAEVDFGLTMDTKKMFLWCMFIGSYLAYQKYNDNVTLKTLMLASVAALLYFYHKEVIDVVKQYFVPRAQTSGMVELFVEGTSLLLFGTKCISSAHGISDLMDSFTSMNNNSRNFTQYVTRCFDWVGQLITYLTTAFGFEWKNIFSNENTEEMQNLSRMLQPLEIKMQAGFLLTDLDKRDLVLVNSKLQDLTMSMAKRPGMLPKNIGLSCIASRIKVLEAYCSASASTPQTRQIPYCVMLTGPPGVGKDVILQNVIAPVLIDHVLSDTEREAQRINPLKYKPISLNPTDKFQQGVTPETVSIVYHDMFAVKTVSSADIMPEDVMLLHLLSSEAFVLKSADVESKGKMYAQPKLVFATTNYAGGGPPPGSTLLNPNAFYRRMEGHVWLAVANPKYVKPQIGQAAFKMTGAPSINLGRLDKERFQEDCLHNTKVSVTGDGDYIINEYTRRPLRSDDSTMFYKYNLEKGVAEGGIYTLAQFLAVVKEDINNHFNHGSYLVESLESIAEEYKAQMMRVDPFKPITVGTEIRPSVDIPLSELFRLALTRSDKLHPHYEAFYYSQLYSIGVQYLSLDVWLRLASKSKDFYEFRPCGPRNPEDRLTYTMRELVEQRSELAERIRKMNYTPNMVAIGNDLLRPDLFDIEQVAKDLSTYSIDITKPHINVCVALDTTNRFWPNFEENHIKPLLLKKMDSLPTVSQHFLRKYVGLSKIKRSIIDQLSPYDGLLVMYDLADSKSLISDTTDEGSFHWVSAKIKNSWDKVSSFIGGLDHSSVYPWLVGAGVALSVLPCIALVKTVYSAVFPESTEYKSQVLAGSEQDDKSISSVVNNNLLWFDIQVSDPRISPVNGVTEMRLVRSNYILMLGGRVGITTAHSFKMPMKAYPGCNFALKLYGMNNMDHTHPDFLVPDGSWTIEPVPGQNDMCFVYLPTIKEYPDIRSKIVDKPAMAYAMSEVKQAYAMATFRPSDSDIPEKRTYTTTFKYNVKPEPVRYATSQKFVKFGASEYIEIPDGCITIDNPVFTNVSFEGACGMPIFIKVKADRITTNFPNANQPMIAAIHCAGSLAGGVAMPISREMFSHIDLCKSGTMQERVERTMKLYKSVKEKYFVSHDYVEPEFLDVPKYNSVGQLVIATRPKITIPMQTSLVKSSLYGNEVLNELIPTDEPYFPALLGNVKEETPEGGYKYVPVIQRNILKYGKNIGGNITFHAYRNLASLYNSKLLENMPDYEKYFYDVALLDDGSIDVDLMYDRFIVGFQDVDNLNNNIKSLPRNKSVGPNVKDYFGFLNRKEVFGEGILPVLGTKESNIIKDLVLGLNADLLDDKNILVMVNAVNKDELRPRSRVINGKTRIFSSSDLPFLILSMIYLRDIIQICKKFRIRNGMLVGINPYSKEWDSLAQQLLEKSEYVMATDHSGFDTDRTEVDWKIFCHFVDRFYLKEHGTKRHACRMRLLDSMSEFITVVPGTGEERFISMYRSLCSGWLITSLYGTYINALTHFSCFVSIMAIGDHYNKTGKEAHLIINDIKQSDMAKYADVVWNSVKAFHYGDDSIISTSMPEAFSIESVTTLMALLFNCTVTDENADIKVDDVHKHMQAFGYVPLDKGVIIARSFNKMLVEDKSGNKEYRFLASLRMSSLSKMAFWDKKGQSHEVLLAKYDLLLKEASLHGKEYHSKMASNLAPEYTKYGVSSPFMEWEYALNFVLDSEYEHFDGDEFVEMI